MNSNFININLSFLSFFYREAETVDSRSVPPVSQRIARRALPTFGGKDAVGGIKVEIKGV